MEPCLKSSYYENLKLLLKHLIVFTPEMKTGFAQHKSLLYPFKYVLNLIQYLASAYKTRYFELFNYI